MQNLSIDEVFDLIGHFFFDQKVYFLVLGIIQTYLAHHLLLNIYTGLESPFICIPKNKTAHNVTLHNSCPNDDPQNCYLHFNSTFKSMQAEWGLVCNEKYKLPLTQSIFMFGVMMGALFLGGLADRIGRLKTLMISLIGMIAFEGCSAFSSQFDLFVALRFVAGVFCALIILSSFVLSQELVGSSYRSFIGVSAGMFFSCGIVLLSILAANISDWRTLSFLSAISGVVLLLIPCYLPESPRWLLIQNRESEARKVLEYIAERNGTIDQLPRQWQLASVNSSENSNQGVKQLFTHSYLRKMTLIQTFSWFVTSCVYYALTMAAGNMNVGGSVYVSTSLNGLVEIPALFITMFTIDRFGRKMSICGFMIFGGSACILIPMVGLYYPSTVLVLALLGKLSITAVFACIYVHASEIYPTIIRNTGMGVTSVAARIGGMVSPFLLLLNDVRPFLHFLVLGLLMASAGFVSWLLPETLNRPMPETVADMLAASKTKAPKVAGYSKLYNADDEDSVFIEDCEK